MNLERVADLRMRNLRLSGAPLKTPQDIVRWLGAVQSQEFGPAKWSIAERVTRLGDAAVDEAFNAGTILRTHVLRPTWHFVLPEDIHWMLALTGPRVRRTMGHYDLKLGLDAALSKKSRRSIERALRDDERMTRQELRAVLDKDGIPAEGQRLNHIVMNAELEGLICSGGLRGKQHTYALLAERAPNARTLSADEALAELTLRYFTSHGPATAKDFRWWSSLTLGEIKRGLEMAGPTLEQEMFDGKTYWFARTAVRRRSKAPRVHLLQPYDEYVVGYTESRYAMDRSGIARARFPVVFGGALLVDGQVQGHYKRTISKDAVRVEATLFRSLDRGEADALEAAARRLGTFLGLRVDLVTTRD